MVAERQMGRDGMQKPSRKQGETAEQQKKTIPPWPVSDWQWAQSAY